jgi:hypothetical protein
VRRFARDNGIAIAFGLIFLASVAGQAIAGWHDFNQEQIAQHADQISLGRFLTSSSFGSAVLENWQSEYLQFSLYILGTIWLLQRGSPESKDLDKPGRQSASDQRIGPDAPADSPLWARVGGIRTALYSNSLLLVMFAIWIGSWLVQSLSSHVEYDANQLANHEAPVSWLQYLGTGDFWNRTLQNWQSEFLAIGSLAVLGIYLRQRGSPESKPVGAPHDATDVEG